MDEADEWQTVSKRSAKLRLSPRYCVPELKTKLVNISQCRRLVLSWAQNEATMDRKRRNTITHALEEGKALEECYLDDVKELGPKDQSESESEVVQSDALLWVRQMGLVREHYFYLEEPDRMRFVTAMVKEFELPSGSSEQDLVRKITNDLKPMLDLNLAKIVNQTRNAVVYNLKDEALKNEINETHFENEEALFGYMKSKVPNWDKGAVAVRVESKAGNEGEYGLKNLGQLLHILHVQRFKIRSTPGRQTGWQDVVDNAQKCQKYCPALGRMLRIACETSPRPGYMFAGISAKDRQTPRIGRCFALPFALDVGPSLVAEKEPGLLEKPVAMKDAEAAGDTQPVEEKIAEAVEKQVEPEKGVAEDETGALTTLLSKSHPFLGPQRKPRVAKTI